MMVSYGKHSIDTSDVAEAGVEYLLQYGFAQSLQDSLAGKRAKLAADGLADDEIEAELDNILTARVAKIQAGTIGATMPSASRDPLGGEMAKVAVAELTASLAKQNVKMPTGKKTVLVAGENMTRATLVARYMAKHDARLRTVAAERITQITEAVAEIDI